VRVEKKVKTYENDDPFHIVLPGFDQCLVVAFGFFHINRPKLDGPLVVLLGFMRVESVCGDRMSLAEMFVTLHIGGWGTLLGRILLFSVSSTDEFALTRRKRLNATDLIPTMLRSVPRGHDLFP